MRVTELVIGSYLAYRTRPNSPAEAAAAGIVHHSIKKGQAKAIFRYAAMLATLENDSELARHLARAGVLVPVPKSSVHQPDSQWVPLMIAEALNFLGIGTGVEPLLERHTPVPKSGGVFRSEDRPSVQDHFDSMRVTSGLYGPDRVTLIDDVVTIGRTMFGAANRINDAYPDAEIQAFSLVRALNYTGISTLAEMPRPLVGRYWRQLDRPDFFIRHDPPH